MSKTMGRWLAPACTWLKPYVNTYRWLGLPGGVTSAYAYPSTLVQPSGGYLYPPPLGSCKPKELERKLFYSLEGRVWNLPQAIATQRASHYDDKANLLWELSEQFHHHTPADHPDFHFKLKRCIQRVHEYPHEVISLIVDGSCNLYHWLFDALPRLCHVEKAGFTTQAIYANFSKPFVRQSLDMMGLKDGPFLDASQLPALRARQMIIPSFILYAGRSYKPAVPLWALQWLRQKLGLPAALGKPSKKIFISRKDATYRHLKDEDQFFELLQSRGFERYELSQMSLQEQRELFATSSVIIAPHGAGLSNLVFCEPGTQVLELFHPGFIQNCYWQIASALELSYYCLLGSYQELDPAQRYPFADIDIQKHEMEGALKQMRL